MTSQIELLDFFIVLRYDPIYRSIDEFSKLELTEKIRASKAPATDNITEDKTEESDDTDFDKLLDNIF